MVFLKYRLDGVNIARSNDYEFPKAIEIGAIRDGKGEGKNGGRDEEEVADEEKRGCAKFGGEA